MGEAKARGGFEKRKRMAIERNERERIERLKRLAEIERNKTPEQRQKEKEAKMALCQILAISAPYLALTDKDSLFKQLEVFN